MVEGDNRRTGQPHVVVGVLGSLEVRLGDEEVPVGHARQRSVLAALAVDANRVVPVDGLLDRVWGERPPSRARSALRTYLTHLRRALAPAGITITRRGVGYLLTAEPDAVDAHRFHRLLAVARAQEDPRLALGWVEDALALWRGEPLAELDTPWALEVRERLRQERAAAEADRIDWRLECGQHQELLPELAARAAAHPLDERAVGQHMLALYRGGRQADALRHYQRTRHQLADTLGTDPSPSLQEMHQRILTADPALTAPETTASGVVPRQLPAPPRWFTGRDDQLAALDAALDRRGTVVISAIGGAGGIGKTWLALAWAHRHLDRFPDGQLFVDLRGFSAEGRPTDPAVAVRGFLDALATPPDRLPADPQAQAALYRSLVVERRMLIVLDNAATAEQVTPLLPGGDSCAVVVTSRNRLHGLTARHGARPLPLGVLTDAESRALMVAALGADRVTAGDGATADLIALCGGFPLALGLIAARAQPDLPLDDVVTELRGSGLDALDADDPTASLPTVLSWSLRRLTDEQRTVFGLLGIAPGPDTTLPAVAALTGLPSPRARRALVALEEASLLERRPHGRYAMHDLVRAYAATTGHELPDGAREAALGRVMDFHLHTAHSANRLLDPTRQLLQPDPPRPGVHPHPLPDAAAALAWLQAEHTTLLATQRTAVALGHHHTVWHLAWALDTFHYRRGLLRDALATWRAAVDAAAHLPDPALRSRAHRLLGYACSLLHLDEEVTGNLDQALALAVRHRDAAEQAHTHRALANAWGRRGDDRRALDHARSALDLHRTLGRPIWEAEALNAVGWYAACLGQFDTARDHCRAALTLHRQHRHPDGEAATLDTLGYIAHNTGDHQQAVDHYRQAVTLFRALGDAYEVANTLGRLGRPHIALGEHQHARTAWQEALELYREQGLDEDAERMRRQLDDLAEAPESTKP